MVDFIQEHFDAIIALTIVLIIAVLTLCLLTRLFKVAAGVFILSIVIPILFTVFWGDGTEYVSRIASIFGGQRKEQIIDAYAYYRDREAEEPLLDQQLVSQYITDFFSEVHDVSQGVVNHFKADSSSSKAPDEREPVSSSQLPEAWPEESPGAAIISQPPA